jgi:hypothetical protein
MERPKTYAERQLERAEAIQRMEQQLSGSGERPCSITAAEIPDQIERTKPSKTFVVVGISIIVLLIIAQCIAFFSKSTPANQSQKPETTEAAETE